MLLKIIIGIIVLIVLMNIYLRNKRKGFIKKLKSSYIDESQNAIMSKKKKYEEITDVLEIKNSKYVIIKTLPKTTIKVFEFEKEKCTGFFIKSTDMAYSLSDKFKYDKEFDIMENENFFTRGINTSEASKQAYPNFMSNGLTIKFNGKSGKIFKSIPSDSLKYRPLFIYVVHKRESGLNNFINILKNDLIKETSDFNTDKMEIKLW